MTSISQLLPLSSSKLDIASPNGSSAPSSARRNSSAGLPSSFRRIDQSGVFPTCCTLSPLLLHSSSSCLARGSTSSPETARSCPTGLVDGRAKAVGECRHASADHDDGRHAFLLSRLLRRHDEAC